MDAGKLKVDIARCFSLEVTEKYMGTSHAQSNIFAESAKAFLFDNFYILARAQE